MEMMRLISLHRILSLEHASCDHIDKVNEIEPEDGYGCRDLATCDDRKSSNEKSKDNSPRISHDDLSGYISSREKVGNRDDNREYREEKTTILLACQSSIREIELDRETGEYDETNQSKSAGETWNSIRKIHRIKYNYVP